MIKIIDIETAVSGVLKCKGFDVFASEVMVKIHFLE